MAISAEYDYENKLALDKAKLVGRFRLNFLGSKELILDYNQITSKMKEDAVEWLDANRLSIVNPQFSFKTYEGTWYSVSITYSELGTKSQAANTIRQTFKIDSSLGDLDGSGGTMTGTGDGARISAGNDVERAYYWRIVNPDSVDLPATAPNGEIYTKSAQDNGDGTYDVTITKEVAINLSATSAVQAGPGIKEDDPGGYTESTEVNTNDVEQEFVLDGGSVIDAINGEIKRIDNVPLENGKFRTTVTTRTAIPQRVPPLFEAGGPNFPWLEYGSDYITDANNIIVGRNQSWQQVIEDRDRTNVSPAIFKINSMSVRVNDFGLYDYTIISNSPG